MSSRRRRFVGLMAAGALAVMAAASCSGSSGGGSAIPDAAAGVGGGKADSSSGSGGSGGGVPCTIDATDPSAVVRALTVDGGSVIEAPAPAPIGSHPSVTNDGCSQIAVDRGASFIVPFGFSDTDTPVGGCLVTVAGATNHISVDAAHCDGGFDLAGELPLRVTVSKEVCPGTFTLKYAAKADAPAISSYLTTVVEVSNADAAPGAAPKTCVPPEAPPLTGITGAHNKYRAIVGAPPLIWDEALNPQAQQIADTFAATAKIPPEFGKGANLVAYGVSRAGTLDISIGDVVWAFIYPGDECFENTPYPQSCSTCADTELGACMMYSQAVWAASTRLGCAVAPYSNPTLGGDGKVWVCVYDPPGNQDGQAAY